MSVTDIRIAGSFTGFGLVRILEDVVAQPVQWAARKWQTVLDKEHLSSLPDYLRQDMGLSH